MLVAGREISRQNVSNMFGRSFWGLADQALVSLTSFLMMVLLARVLTPEDFGAFVLAYGGLLFANALQSGLFTIPHNVLGATRSGTRYRRYTATTLVTQFGFSLCLAAVALGIYVVGSASGWESASLFLAMAPAVVAWQIQEYLRRVFYTEGRLRAAFMNDCVSYAGQIGFIVLFWQLGWLTGPRAICLLGLTSGLAALVGVWQLRDRIGARFDRRSVGDNWHFGKWLFGASFVQSGRIQLYLWMIGGFVSITAAGLYRAAQNLVAPTHIMMLAVRSVATPRAAAIEEQEGQPAMQQYLTRIAWLGLIPIAIYLLVVSLAAEPLLNALYAGQYDGYAWLVWLFSIVYLLAYAGQILTIMLSAMQIPRAILVAETATLIVAVGIGAPVILAFGIEGAMAVDLIAGLTLLGVLYFRLRQHASEQVSPATAAGLMPMEARSHAD